MFAQTDTRVVMQQLGNALVIPVFDPVQENYLSALTDELLTHLHVNGVTRVILDFSGVEILDSDDFDLFKNIHKLTCLMGASLIFAGLRPGVVAGLTMLNVSTSWVKSALSVEQATRMKA